METLTCEYWDFVVHAGAAALSDTLLDRAPQAGSLRSCEGRVCDMCASAGSAPWCEVRLPLGSRLRVLVGIEGPLSSLLT